MPFPIRNVKILCVCVSGQVRSVALKKELQAIGFEALSAGIRKNTTPTLEMLDRWADRVICIGEPEEFAGNPFSPDKVMVVNIGYDVWKNPESAELRQIIRSHMRQINDFILNGHPTHGNVSA